MQIRITSRQIQLPNETISKMKRRLRFSLSRFGHSIIRVTVQLSNSNGTRGGQYRECLIAVKLQNNGEVIVQGNGTDCSSALNRCADRISRAVDRELARQQQAPIRKMGLMQSTNRKAAAVDER